MFFRFYKIIHENRMDYGSCNPIFKDSDILWLYFPYNADYYWFQCDLVGPIFGLEYVNFKFCDIKYSANPRSQ